MQRNDARSAAAMTVLREVAVLQITAAAKSEKLQLRLLPLRSGCSSQAVCVVVADTGAARLSMTALPLFPPVTPPERSGRRAKQAEN
jgi:hypothetical protein